ncbi:MAG: GNAT family N-acetyltransferase [Candidatus Sumerlaeia bacterium]
MKIEYLADHTHFIPTLARWFHAEWGYLYPERTVEILNGLVAERANRDRIPLTLVAIDGDEVVGTVCLKVNDMSIRPELAPWLACLYVDENHRRQGIGEALVAAIEKESARLGVNKLYLFTPSEEKFYAKRGWSVRERVNYLHCDVTVMEKRL